MALEDWHMILGTDCYVTIRPKVYDLSEWGRGKKKRHGRILIDKVEGGYLVKKMVDDITLQVWVYKTKTEARKHISSYVRHCKK